MADYVGRVEAGGFLIMAMATENGGIICDRAGKCRGLRCIVPEVRVDCDVERSDASGVADAAGEHGVNGRERSIIGMLWVEAIETWFDCRNGRKV